MQIAVESDAADAQYNGFEGPDEKDGEGGDSDGIDVSHCKSHGMEGPPCKAQAHEAQKQGAERASSQELPFNAPKRGRLRCPGDDAVEHALAVSAEYKDVADVGGTGCAVAEVEGVDN